MAEKTIGQLWDEEQATRLQAEVRAIVREAQRLAWERGQRAGYSQLPVKNPYGAAPGSGGFLCPHGLDLCVQCMEAAGLERREITSLVDAYLRRRSGFPLTHTLE